MEAMIFAAGLGTRLQPLTLSRPKALVEVGGMTMLERVARRLIAAGADHLVINTHPFADQIERLVKERRGFGVEVSISHEPDGPLDTAGGLQRAVHLFRGDAPIFLHNCDVLSSFDLHALYAHQRAHDALATLAVLPPSAERYLIFDEDGLCGYSPRGGGDDVYVRIPSGKPARRDFSGIHVIAPELLRMLQDVISPSIVMHYLSLSKRGSRIGRYEQDGVEWIDIGSHEKLAHASAMIAELDT